mgnify:CR=1 FL=1
MPKELEAVAAAIEALAKPINESAMTQVQIFHELADAAQAAAGEIPVETVNLGAHAGS